MGFHVYEREQVVDFAHDEVFAFFSTPANLPRVTPPALGFRFEQTPPSSLQMGAEIRYRVTVSGIPLRWVTRVTDWDPPHRFADVQARGPYAYWLHTHTFRALAGASTLVRDRVIYRLPMGLLGEIARPLIVEPQLRRIFDHRERILGAVIWESRPA